MEVTIFIIEKPYPVALFFVFGMLQDYRTKALYKATGHEETWNSISCAPTFRNLGFDDGLIVEPYKNTEDGRLLLSGHSLWRLALANANQRTDLDASAESIGTFFVGNDKERVKHWMHNVLPAIFEPDRFPAADDMTRNILAGEARLRQPTWIAIKQLVRRPAELAARPIL